MAGKPRALWVYGVVEKSAGSALSPLPMKNYSLHSMGSGVFTVSHRDLSAVVSGVARCDFRDVPGEDLVAMHAPEHERVLRHLLDTTSGALAPFSFGSIAESVADVQQILTRGYLQFKSAVEESRGKVEMHVTARWNEMQEVQHIAATDDEVQRLRQATLSTTGEESTRLQVEAGKRVFELLQERKQQCLQRIMDALTDIVLESCPRPIREESVILDQALLLEQKQMGEFKRRWGQWTSRTTGDEPPPSGSARAMGAGLRFQCGGPYPLYSFIHLKLSTSDYEAVQQARELLQLDEEASAADVRKAYRRLAQQWHPDKNGGEGETTTTFRRLEEAYRLLRTYCDHYPCSLHDAAVKKTQIVSEPYRGAAIGIYPVGI